MSTFNGKSAHETMANGSVGAQITGSTHGSESNGNGTKPVSYPVDSQFVIDPGGTRLLFEHPAFPPKNKPRHRWMRWLLMAGVASAIVVAGVYFGWPHLRYALDTVSTDDAFVSGHITNVSPRIQDVVTEVLVDQNDRVEPGTLLVLLDREPFELALEQSQASVDEARANVVQARAQVRSQIARARGAYYARENAQENLRRQIATLHAQFAALTSRQASLQLRAKQPGARPCARVERRYQQGRRR